MTRLFKVVVMVKIGLLLKLSFKSIFTKAIASILLEAAIVFQTVQSSIGNKYFTARLGL
jgi:hypothetical protein